MLFLKLKNIKNQKKFYNQEFTRLKLKFLFTFMLQQQQFLKFSNKKNYITLTSIFLMKYQIKNYFKTKINRRCLFNNRSKIMFRQFSISRVLFREMLQLGIVPGFKKAVW